MEKGIANLSLEYVEESYDNPKVITLYADGNLIVDKQDLRENMNYSISAATIKIVIESIKNKGIKHKLLFYLLSILDIYNGFGLKSIVHSRMRYVLILKVTGNEAYITVKFDAEQTKDPFSIRKSNHVEVVSWEKTTRNK
ncbi:hypothetical protein [Paenibacillus kobensis]|uniref:hypothetical protein n=1 Tax=Paenibacillus kobensis TaxID=59841 RepID=UPI000FDBD0F7|nr:hypothetical protein [Paenibacillus kobensis]